MSCHGGKRKVIYYSDDNQPHMDQVNRILRDTKARIRVDTATRMVTVIGNEGSGQDTVTLCEVVL